MIHGFLCGRALPSLYCYLSGKSEVLYGELFDVTLSHVDQRPKSMRIDFEKAVENVIKQKLPTTNVSYCLFHFKQALWKRTHVVIQYSYSENSILSILIIIDPSFQSLGLQPLFVDNHEVRRCLKNFGCSTLILEQFVYC